ncbi:unnamed protein product [Larinioides sclopetarius]|uniref:Uncharacterized protein n=1 Tax=Larinioides sclopetarius TaxID=280406 RepID=A0AAV1ZNI6_9ARAC
MAVVFTMPRKRNSNFGRCTSNAKWVRLLRDEENEVEKEVRLENVRIRKATAEEWLPVTSLIYIKIYSGWMIVLLNISPHL